MKNAGRSMSRPAGNLFGSIRRFDLRPILAEQFQEKCEAVFRPELRQNKKIERFCVSVKR
ncbi:hypothetical protein [Mesorhizobium sp. LjNodule214]|uniref:hypothetical protein n=1 Tax=Mesorhizobium sp. LjNodule214 TaxID=3342252 RepID=UPI003ECCFBD3